MKGESRKEISDRASPKSIFTCILSWYSLLYLLILKWVWILLITFDILFMLFIFQQSSGSHQYHTIYLSMTNFSGLNFDKICVWGNRVQVFWKSICFLRHFEGIFSLFSLQLRIYTHGSSHYLSFWSPYLMPNAKFWGILYLYLICIKFISTFLKAHPSKEQGSQIKITKASLMPLSENTFACPQKSIGIVLMEVGVKDVDIFPNST